ncbi:glucoside xylosyltransferase 1, partial [Plakobranchus ocellatus]
DGAVSGSSAVHLCVVVCGTRGQETMTMLKSATMVTPLNISLIFHIFAEPEIQNFFQDELDLWPLVHRHRLSYHIYNVTFPDSSTTNAWKKLFKPCASQRLFLPNLLQSVERLIYVDTDTVFLESLTHLWEMFNDFNSSQLAGLVGEAEAGYAAWYNRFANHPFYGKFGLNSGVMLMDLNRLRQTSWLSDMQRLFLQYRLALPWGDQDLINIYFAFHPDQMYLMPCKWNYRNDHCRYSSNCVSAEESGVSVLHGSRRTFESGKEPVLQIIHRAFSKYQLGDDMEFHFLENLVAELEDVKHTASNCWKASSFFLIQLKLLKERNREFMQASRKANQRLSSGRRQSRSGSRQKDVDMGHVYHQPGHSQRAGAKGQPLPKNQKKLTERWERTESEEQLTREKLFMSKSKRDVPLQTQREESVEGQIDGRNRVSFHLRGNETDKSDEIFKLRKIERNSSKLTDSKENLRRQKTGDKHSSYQRHPGDDHVNLTRLKSSAVMSKEKGKNHNKSGSSVHEKAARPDDLSVPKDSAQNSVLKADSDLDLTNDIFHRAADGSHKSAKSVLKMAVDHTGEQGVHEEGLKKRMPKIEEQKIDYDDTDDRDEMQKVFMSVRESERKSEKKPFLNAQI